MTLAHFEGNSAYEKLSNGLEEIVSGGEVVKRVGREDAYNITHKGFIVGINKGYDKQGNNYWIVTAFDKNKPLQEKTIRTARVNDLTKEPNNPSLNSKDDPTTPPLKNQEFKAKATELYNIAKAQEIEFKGFLENLKSANNSLELGQILKSEASIESKIARKQGDISKISDYLRGAVISKDRTHLDTELVRLEDSLKSRGIKPTIELQHRNASGYKGVHVQFEFNGVPSEIQLHTAKNWRIKKRLDPLYHELREHEIKNTLTWEEVENIKAASRRLGQDSDLDIKALTSFAVKSDSASNSEKSVLVRKSLEDLKAIQEPLEKSNSKPISSESEIAYNRPESVLSEKSNLSGGKGKIESSIDKPLLSSIQATQSPLKSQAIPHNKAFGTNFEEFYHDPKGAIAKLLETKEGQVAGAFYREDLGDIDLVWGEIRDQKVIYKVMAK
ncbi:hypothetical protein [Helicobacter suis]|uniref:putative barnase/colicin E5 family endoribonuclease n=1 Tax=Helicobacter suis TaxID=104628 RepID=UPI0031F93F74